MSHLRRTDEKVGITASERFSGPYKRCLRQRPAIGRLVPIVNHHLSLDRFGCDYLRLAREFLLAWEPLSLHHGDANDSSIRSIASLIVPVAEST